MEKIEKKQLLRIAFVLASPMVIGSGKTEYTDHDIIRDSEGKPYIPGTAVAGVTRSVLENKQLKGTEISAEDSKKYFGYVSTQSTENDRGAFTSKIMFYDAKLIKDNGSEHSGYHTSKRDSVSLDDWKTAKKGAKFDMEVLETGAKFVTYVEQNYCDGDIDYLEKIATWWKSGNIRFGAKTMRGYGSIKDVVIDRITVHMDNEEELENWLNHTMYDDSFWTEGSAEFNIDARKVNNYEYPLIIDLSVDSSLSIRKYTTTPTKEDDLVAQPDYEQLKLHDNTPVIPGTTWAGAFRRNMRKLVPDLDETYFGNVIPGKKIKKQSGILFSESIVKDGHPKVISRTAIDRFSGGVIDAALYTERTQYGGTTNLEIRFCKGKPSDVVLRALAASVADLHAGILAVGGLTAVGRGLFKVTGINGTVAAEKPEDVYRQVMEAFETIFKRSETEVGNNG